MHEPLTSSSLKRHMEWLHRPRWSARRLGYAGWMTYWTGTSWSQDRTRALRFGTTERLDEAIAAAHPGVDPGHYEYALLEDQ